MVEENGTGEKKELTLEEYSLLFEATGMNRVMISQHEATSPDRAHEQHGIDPDIVFLRNDGWMLGAPTDLEFEAYCTWSSEWIGFVRRPSFDFMPMSEYRVNREPN